MKLVKMNIDGYINAQRFVKLSLGLPIRCDAEEPDDWITVNGNHIPINEEREAIGGQLKAFGRGDTPNGEQNAAEKMRGVIEGPDRNGIIKSNNAEEQSRLNPGHDERAIVSDIVGTDEYSNRMKRVGESEKNTNIMLFESRKTLWRRNGTAFEDLIYLDPETGKHVAQRSMDVVGGVEPTEEMKEMVNNKHRRIIAIHNHPHNMLPSLSDLKSAKKYKYSVIACHDGTIIKLKVAKNANLTQADLLMDLMQPHFNNREDLSNQLSVLSSLGVDMEVIR